MISIIVSTYKPVALSRFLNSVETTIGCPYEVIPIENHGYFGICEAYNRGASKAQFDILCFIHEDVIMRTKNWGQKLIEIMKDESIGLVGVAGQTYRSRVPSTWISWHVSPKSIFMNIIQHKSGSIVEVERVNQLEQTLLDVAVCDGVFLSTRKNDTGNNIFDQKTFTDFHFYDMDISIQTFISMKRVCVTMDILLEHYSEGSISKKWFREANRFFKKWKDVLPIYVNQQSKIEHDECEQENKKRLSLICLDKRNISINSLLLVIRVCGLFFLLKIMCVKIKWLFLGENDAKK